MATAEDGVAAAESTTSHTATNYDKWDMLDLSDDEDVSDCHPNIDGKLWLRLKKEKQHRKWQEEDAELHALEQEMAARKKKLGDVEAEIQRRKDAGFGDEQSLGALQAQIATIAGEMEESARKKAKMEERKTWRSSEVAEVADGELVSEERKALDRQEEIAELSLEERMAKAEEGKAAGTALFKQQQWAAARDAYSDGFDYVRLLEQPEQLRQAADIRLALANNLAMCCLKTEEWGKAVSFANRALDVEPDNPKAVYRRGWGSLGARDFEDAVKDLTRAAKLSPKDKAIRKKLKEAKAARDKALKPKTDDEKADEYVENAQKHDAVYRHFAYLRDDDKSEEYINDHPELLNEHATGWMLLHCLELEMEGKSREMHKVARQNEMLEYITRSCREVKIVDDPRAATMPFFRSLRHPDPRARDGFHSDMQGVIDKITARAKEKKLEQAAAAEEAEEEIIVEKMEQAGEPGVEYLVDKKGGRVFRELEPGQLEQVRTLCAVPL